MSKIKDLTGQRFGRLVVLYKNGTAKNGNVLWRCQCDCGNLCTVDAQNLQKGITKSCGCYQKKITSQRSKQYNSYDLTQEYGIGYDNKGLPFYFDIEDYDKIKEVCWIVNPKDNRVSGRYQNKVIKLHQLILDFPKDVIIDHINNKPYDNRKCNLRFATKQTNGINRPHNKNNKLGIKGVSQLANGKYMARIMVDYKNVYLGCFDNIEDAKQVRQDAEIKYFGEYAYKGGEIDDK